MAAKRLHGVHVPHRKNTRESVPVRMPAPARICLPMSMHIGKPAVPVVKVGDQVLVGERIAEANGAMSSPVYTGVSGKVVKIEDMLLSSGQKAPAVFIESDGKQTALQSVPPTVTSYGEFIAAVRESGVVGLGGAGFPTAIKLDVKDLSKVEAVVVNGAECEPYITSDTRTMLDHPDLVCGGIALLREYLQVKRVIIGIEDNKPDCIRTFSQACRNDAGVKVASLPALYPQGGEKVLIYHTTGRIVPEGKLPLDAGVIVVNCTTLAAIARYIKTGIPYYEKCVTVDGTAVKTPSNVIVPIGTPAKDVFEFCGGFQSEPRKVLYGGPMMGISVPELEQPVLKNTNALLAFAEADAELPAETACIHCGRCIAHCPMKLAPVEIERAYRQDKTEELEALKVNLCMECGCCAYVCPANRNLVQVNKLSKARLRTWQAAQNLAKEASK